MTVVLLAPHWAGNARIQRAANNAPPLRQGDGDATAVRLLQSALIQVGIPVVKGADGAFGPNTATAVRAAEARFGFTQDAGIGGREVLGALDLALRGWSPPAGAHWGGLIAKTIVPLANRKAGRAIQALTDVSNMFGGGGAFDFVTADGVTMAALKAHFKLVPPGGAKQPIEEFITASAIAGLLKTFNGIRRTINTPALLRHSICTLGLDTAAEATFGGHVLFGPPYSDFRFDPVATTNIDITGPNSLCAMMLHEATHVVDSISGNDDIHISEFTQPYEVQPANRARHNPSAYATFAAHIDDGADRPRLQRYGLGAGRPL